MTSTQILGEATIGSATRRTTRNTITMQAGKKNDVELIPKTIIGSAVRRSTSNTTTMQAGKSNDVEPVLKTSVGEILIREGLTSTRVIPQSPTRLRHLKSKGKAVL